MDLQKYFFPSDPDDTLEFYTNLFMALSPQRLALSDYIFKPFAIEIWLCLWITVFYREAPLNIAIKIIGEKEDFWQCFCDMLTTQFKKYKRDHP